MTLAEFLRRAARGARCQNECWVPAVTRVEEKKIWPTSYATNFDWKYLMTKCTSPLLLCPSYVKFPSQYVSHDVADENRKIGTLFANAGSTQGQCKLVVSLQISAGARERRRRKGPGVPGVPNSHSTQCSLAEYAKYDFRSNGVVGHHYGWSTHSAMIVMFTFTTYNSPYYH